MLTTNEERTSTNIREMIIRHFEKDLENIHGVPFEFVTEDGRGYLKSEDRRYNFSIENNDLKSMKYDSYDLAFFAFEVEESTKEKLGVGIDISPILKNPYIWSRGLSRLSPTPDNIIKFVEFKYNTKRIM